MYKFSKSGPTGGETFTVTCFTCGMPSSKEWAQLVQSRPCSPDLSVPFYPFLLQATPPPGALFSENGTYLCAFCHALLDAQWNSYEGKKEPLSPLQRKYIIHKFICAVCAVETYRKRVRALPFQEFPFLAKTRQPGSITLGNNPLAVVCLDCSETLWAQSAEYDRWGLPVHKRHFNWMARPPPPEDSVEATVARLPSGETQLPRCPPTDPLVPPKTNEPTAQPEAIPPIKYSRPRPNSVVSGPRGEIAGSFASQQAKYSQQIQLHRQGMSPLSLTRGPQTSPRKIINANLEPSTSSLDVVNPHVQPPIVTVAPMSLHHSAQLSRKNSVVYTLSHIEDRSSPNNKHGTSSSSSYGRTHSSDHHHYESSSHHDHPSSALNFPPHLVPYYSPSAWPSQAHHTNEDVVTEYGEQDFCATGHRHPSSEGVTWRQRGSPNVLHHYPHAYTSPNNNHERTVSDPNFSSPPSLIGHPLSLAALFPQLRLQQSTTSTPPSTVRLESPASRISSSSPRDYEICTTSPSRNIGDHHNSRNRTHSSTSNRQRYPRYPPITSYNNDSSEDETVGRITKKINANVHVESRGSEYYQNIQRRSSPFEDVLIDRSGGSSGDGDEMPDEAHSGGGSGSSRRKDFLLPKKRHWEPSPSLQCFVPSSSSSDIISSAIAGDKSSVSSTTSSEILSVLAKKRKFSTNLRDKDSNTDGAIDLSMTQPSSCQLPNSTSKFSIAYLCKSETGPVNDGDIKPYKLDSVSLDTGICRTVISPIGVNRECKSDIVQHAKNNIRDPGQMDDNLNSGRSLETSLLSLKKVNLDESASLKEGESFTNETMDATMAKEAAAKPVINKIQDKQCNSLLGIEQGIAPPLKLRDICLARIRSQFPIEAFRKTSPKEFDTAQMLFLQTLGLQPKTGTNKSGPSCIKYPKYIPGARNITQANIEQQNKPSGSTIKEQMCTDSKGMETVLRIPVIHKQMTNSSIFEDGVDGIQSTKASTAETQTLQSILENSALYFKKSSKLLAKAIKEIKSSSWCMEEQLSRLEKIRKYINMQQSDLQETQAEFAELEIHVAQRFGSAEKSRQSLPKP